MLDSSSIEDLRRIIALHARGKNIEDSINFKNIFGDDREENKHFKKLWNSDIMPSDMRRMIKAALDARRLYSMAARLCKVLEQDGNDSQDLRHLKNGIGSSIRRVDDIIKILNSKAEKWGIAEKPESDQDTELEGAKSRERVKRTMLPSPLEEPESIADVAEADDKDDGIDADSLRAELKHTLKKLADIIDYLEKPTLNKIRIELDKIVGY